MSSDVTTSADRCGHPRDEPVEITQERLGVLTVSRRVTSLQCQVLGRSARRPMRATGLVGLYGAQLASALIGFGGVESTGARP
jgi:hypothetical protein